ncbi:MAG: pilin [Pseudomonadota bacterium]
MNKSNKSDGFTLIELMIVVAIIGILASLAISTYQTYTIRAQVAEGIRMATGAKSSIGESFFDTGDAPANRLAAGMTQNATDTSSKYVSAIGVDNGRVSVTFGNDANVQIAGGILYLTPYEDSGLNIIWRCGNAEVGPALNPVGTASGGNVAVYAASTLENRYLPSACR